MSDKFWNGRVVVSRIYETFPETAEEGDQRRIDFLTESALSVEIDLDADSIADLREMCSPDVLDAAVLITDNGANP